MVVDTEETSFTLTQTHNIHSNTNTLLHKQSQIMIIGGSFSNSIYPTSCSLTLVRDWGFSYSPLARSRRCSVWSPAGTRSEGRGPT